MMYKASQFIAGAVCIVSCLFAGISKADDSAWVQALASAPWQTRCMHATTVFDNKYGSWEER